MAANDLARGAFAAALAALVTACGTPSPPPSDINISDNGAFVGSARVSIVVRPREAPSQAQSGHAFELGVSRTSGSDDQTLSAGQPVRFGGQAFFPPRELHHEFDFTYVEAAYRWRYFSDSAGVELRGGIAYADLGLTVSSGSLRASDSLGTGGANVGAGVVFRLRPSTSLEGRLTFFASASDTNVSEAQRFELYLAQALGRNFAARAGYVAWRVESERGSGDNLSPIKARFSGPSLGLDLAF